MSGIAPKIQCITAAENAVMLTLEPESHAHPVSIGLNEQLHQLAHWLLTKHSDVIIEVVPSYASMLVYYDALAIAEDEFIQQVITAIDWHQLQVTSKHESAVVTHCVDVCYASELAPDLTRVAHHARLSVDDVIALHQQPLYHVYALGFAPGFAYLGDVPESIRCPRLDTPRTKVPAGSVAIANQQTSVYPAASPGGWNLIGRVVTLPQLKAGDKVRFQAIDLNTWKARQQHD